MYRRMMDVGVSSGWVTHSNADSNNSKDGLTNTSQYSVVEWSWWRYDINGKIKTGFSVISHMQLVGFCDQHGLCVCVCVCDKTVSPDSVISCTKPKKLPLLLPLFLLDWKIGRGPLLSLTDEFFISYICLNTNFLNFSPSIFFIQKEKGIRHTQLLCLAIHARTRKLTSTSCNLTSTLLHSKSDPIVS